MISSDSVRTICQANGIANVTIIDDVFDPPALSLSPAEMQTLFEAFELSPDVRTTLQNLGVELTEPADLTAQVFDQVKALAEQDDAGATEAWTLISGLAEARRANLNRMKQRLRRELKLSVKSVGAAAAERRKKIVPDDSNVIFLDFELRADEVRGTLSSAFVKRIYEQFKDRAAAPLVILMSSSKLSDDDLEAFQKQTELLSGMFYFVEKDDLFSVEKLNYRLAAFAKSLSTGQTMQRFIHQVEAGLAEAKRKVFRDIRSLSIADYAFLQSVRLNDDGQPMGEYLMWMFNAHLVRELGTSETVRAVEALVDDLKFDHLPPTQAKPSASLGALYSSAVMRPMDPLPAQPTNSASYLQFGDLFQNNGKKVWLCITPACDLAFGDARPLPSDRSVLFLPGELLPLDKPLKSYQQRQPRTELIQLSGKTYRVVWNTKEVAQTKYGALQTFLNGKKIKRIARLNAPFAIEVQRAFAADLTRIGMPTPPPLYNPVKVRLSCLNEHGAEVELTTAATCGALISGGERGEKLVLGSEFMDALPSMLAQAESVTKSRHKTLAAAVAGEHEEPLVNGAAEAHAKLVAARKDVAVLGGVRGPFKLDPNGLTVLDGLMTVLELGSTVQQPAASPLRLVVLPAEEMILDGNPPPENPSKATVVAA